MFHPFFWLLQVAQETGRVQMKDTRYVYCDGRILRTSVWKKFAYIYITLYFVFLQSGSGKVPGNRDIYQPVTKPPTPVENGVSALCATHISSGC